MVTGQNWSGENLTLRIEHTKTIHKNTAYNSKMCQMCIIGGCPTQVWFGAVAPQPNGTRFSNWWHTAVKQVPMEIRKELTH